MIRLSVDADISGEVNLLGKVVTDLQSGITISNNRVTGTSKWVTGFTGFSGSAELQSGNYLALHCEASDSDAAISTQMIPGYSGPRLLDADGLCIYRVESVGQDIRYTAMKAGKVTEVLDLDLSGLTLTPETPTIDVDDADANNDNVYSDQELMALTKAQLLELAGTLGVTGVSSANNKSEIIAAILAAQED